MWLKDIGLTKYWKQLETEGYDEIPILVDLSDAEIAELATYLKMPKGHAHQLKKAIAKLQPSSLSK
jgi:hypothetical protein